MEELCSLFRKQQLLCPDENNSILKESFTTTRDMLRKVSTTPFSHSELHTYLINTQNRYRLYVNKLKFRRTLLYLDTMLTGVMQKIENLLSYGGDISMDQMKEVGEILLLSFFIDCDLLFAIGAMYMDDE